MTLQRRRLVRAAAGSVTAPAFACRAGAAADAGREVRIVVGYPPGGPLDLAARVIAPWLAARLDRPFVVENRPGESGNLATHAVVRAAPDGFTLLLCGPVHTINSTLFPGLDFRFTDDIVPVGGIARVPLIVEVHPSVPARSPADFIGYARDNPGKLRVAYAGVGTPQHVAIELFRSMASVDLTLVPYVGSAAALDDLLIGKADLMFDPVPSSIEHVRAGRLIAIAVTSAGRSEFLPGVPAMSETVPGYEGGSWFGIGAPRGTPAQSVDMLNAAINAGLDDPAVRARLSALGATPMPGSTAEFGAFIAAETTKYADVIRKAGIKVR